MCDRRWVIGVGLVAALLVAVLLVAAPAAVAAEKATVYEMQEVSLLDKDLKAEMGSMSLGSGQSARCTFVRSPQVKKYPELNSDQPIYGSVTFIADPTDRATIKTFYFVVDESAAGESQGKETAEATEERSVLKTLGAALSGTSTPVANLTGKKYDRLYFDANGDLDLTNDAVVKPMEDPPTALRSSYQQVMFDTVSVEFDYGGELGTRGVKVVPRLLTSSRTSLAYFMPTTAWKGKIRMGDREYNALLRQTRGFTGRFDQPMTELRLTPVGASPGSNPYLNRYNYLGMMRCIDGKLYEISASPSGDKLTVGPYSGETGLVRVDPGDRDIAADKLAVRGMLTSKDRMMVPLGDFSPMATEKAQEYQVPAGDYMPSMLYVDFGRVRVTLGANPYSFDESGTPVRKATAYGLKIGKDNPFVLDFSGKPKVAFTSPAKNQTCKLGQTLKLSAMIVDPKLDLLIRGLEDTTKQIGERKYPGADGQTVSVPTYATLTPTVAITNAKGEKVAGGTMPFG